MNNLLLRAAIVAIFVGPLSQLPRSSATAADPPKAASKPIRALLVTGGCCHDYARQKLILTRGISARANVVWTVVHQGGKSTNAKIPLYENPNWADGFDVVVHNECFANVPDVQWVDRILKPHREGVPAVLIHCAMHCYRTGTDNWFEFVGLQSPGHGPHYAYTVENLQPDNPIMAGFGDRWTTSKGELYHAVKLFPNAMPLAHARRKNDNEPQVCVWTNQYKKGRVFGTTIGHYNETMAEPTYLDMVSRGLLWSVGRLDDSEFKAADEKSNESIQALLTAPVKSTTATATPSAGKCCGEGNLAIGKPTKANSEETNKNNFANKAVDGDLNTRWCAANPNAGAQWQVDLGKSDHVRSVRMHWEQQNVAYRYLVEASADGNNWKTIVDQTKNDTVAKITPHTVDAPDTRHLRVTFHGSSTGGWGSLWEFEAYGGELPKLPASVTSTRVAPAAKVADVKMNPGDADQHFNVTLFGTPPDVNYPVCIAAAATGELFVGVDEQGSLGKKPGGGRILRCLDTDGDGVADRINTFAEIDHPRGLIYDDGSLWVLHPPFLTVHHDDDRDGIADRNETLITGISTDQVNREGADHTTNGIRMGIDGWIYIAVGDFGFNEAEGADGTTLGRRGGGIVRVRPDGSEMEIYNWGLRNILDVCIDPYMNVFTRDNTNDGGGWNVRLSDIHQSAEYGYPSLYKNFAGELMPPLADYGGGSGCGGMFVHDLRWPEPFGNALYTCDWGRSEVYRHNLPANGATFDAHQETFLKIPRPTDIDVDGSGRMYVSSWKDGKFNYSGPNVGFVAQITPKDFVPRPFPDLKAAGDPELLGYLASPSAVYRLHAQRELLRRGQAQVVNRAANESAAARKTNELRASQLADMAADDSVPLYGRVAAIFTLKQLAGQDSHAALQKLVGHAAVREFALRAMTDRKSQLDGLSTAPFISALADENPRVRAQALISLGRLGDPTTGEAIIPLTRYATDPLPAHDKPDPSRVIPHLAIRALVATAAVDACLKALDGSDADGALWALRYMHNETAVQGLINQLGKTRDTARRGAILATLIRLYHREGEYSGNWWGTRPDTSGPYYDRKTWSASDRIGQVIHTAVLDSNKPTAEFLRGELTRHKVKIPGLPGADAVAAVQTESQKPIALPQADPKDPNQIANLPIEESMRRATTASGQADRGKLLFTQQSCIACHSYADGQMPKGPHLVDIGKRYKRAELVESVLKPTAKIAQGFDTYEFITVDGKIITGFVVSESADAVQIRQTDGLAVELNKADIDERNKQELSMMPTGLANNLTPEQLADLIAYLESLH